jgi:hypothetical protein
MTSFWELLQEWGGLEGGNFPRQTMQGGRRVCVSVNHTARPAQGMLESRLREQRFDRPSCYHIHIV